MQDTVWKENPKAIRLSKPAKKKCSNNFSENSCKATIQYAINILFPHKWNDAMKPCEQRLMILSEIVLNEKRADQLLPFGDLSPPSSSEVRGAIEDMFNNARKNSQ